MLYRKIKLNVPDLHHEFSIDTLGVVRNETLGKVLKGTSISNHNRYVKIHLQKFHALHRLVAEHFIPNPDNRQYVNHIDGNRYNNMADNLEWCTHSHNMKHAYRTGLKTNKGEINPVNILSEEEVKLIWSLRHTGLTARQIRDRLNLSVSIDAVKSIRQGKNWGWLTSTLS